MPSHTILSSILIGLLINVSGFYFNVNDSERKCFLEDLPIDTNVIVNYKVQQFDGRINSFSAASSNSGVLVEITQGAQLVPSRGHGTQQSLVFTSIKSGIYLICFSPNSTWLSNTRFRIYVDMRVGEHTIDYTNIAKKEKLTEVQLRVRQLIDQVEQIIKEQNYQRTREVRFRYTSDSTNSNVLWWALVQTVALICIGFWQIRHLKKFFLVKKLV